MVEQDTNKFPDYVTFGRTFEKYRWYKPLLTIVVSVVLLFVFQFILMLIFSTIYGPMSFMNAITGGYDTLNSSDASVYFSYLAIAVFLPALYIASRVVSDRPFSSYSSSRGGWDWKIYFKCLIIPLIIYIVYTVADFAIHGPKGHAGQTSQILLVIAVILIPLQCIAEEYMFRGLLMQTFGSWIKIPILAVIVQALIFALLHPYNIIGVITILISGLIFGLLAWRTNGLEAGAALHSINNLMGFYVIALGLGTLSSAVSVFDSLADIIIAVISALLIYYIGSKKGWFDQKTSESKLF